MSDAERSAVERAAIALYLQDENGSMSDAQWPAWDSKENAARELYRDNARAALAAALGQEVADWDRLRTKLAAVEAVLRDMWRVTPCGCGHRADLHTMGAVDPPVCVGGLGICGCSWSFRRIVHHRITEAVR